LRTSCIFRPEATQAIFGRAVLRYDLILAQPTPPSYQRSQKPLPDIADIRLPNPLDLKLFDKTCFLNNGQVAFQTAR
jgi:hypothetical protein